MVSTLTAAAIGYRRSRSWFQRPQLTENNEKRETIMNILEATCVRRFLGAVKKAIPYALCLALAAAGLLAKDMPQRSCTSLFLSAADGTRVFGTNLDYQFSRGRLYVNPRGITKQGWSEGTTGTVASWTSKYGNLTFNLAGYQLAWAGMNEAGLVISTMALDSTANPPADSRPPLESGFWVQYVLDSCATVTEVRQTDTKVRMARTVDHYLISDRSGRCAVIEFLDGQMVCHIGRDLPVSALTNSEYDHSVIAWRTGKPLEGDSLVRFGAAADRVKRYTDSDPVEYAFSALFAVRREWTAWSIVFDARSLQASFFTRGHPSLKSVSFAGLNFSPTAQTRMLDINADLSGDVTDALVPYSHEDALSHMSAAFKVFTPAMSPKEVDSFLRFLEFGSAVQPKE